MAANPTIARSRLVRSCCRVGLAGGHRKVGRKCRYGVPRLSATVSPVRAMSLVAASQRSRHPHGASQASVDPKAPLAERLRAGVLAVPPTDLVPVQLLKKYIAYARYGGATRAR